MTTLVRRRAAFAHYAMRPGIAGMTCKMPNECCAPLGSNGNLAVKLLRTELVKRALAS